MQFGGKLLRRVDGGSKLPLTFVPGLPRIELEGLDTVRVEQHRGLAAYDSNLVVVRCSGAELHVHGNGLTLESMTAGELQLRGRILNLELVY